MEEARSRLEGAGGQGARARRNPSQEHTGRRNTPCERGRQRQPPGAAEAGPLRLRARGQERATALVQLELELARVEVKNKTTQIGIGVGLGVGAGLFAFIGLVFLFATIAAGLATFLAVWLSLLIVTLLLVALCAVCGLLAKSFVKRGAPPSADGGDSRGAAHVEGTGAMTEIVPQPPSEQPVVPAEPPPLPAAKPPAPEPPKERSQQELITLIQSEREGLVTAVADLRAALERLKKQKARARR